MKILMEPIEMIAWFGTEGMPRPLRFKLKKETEENVYKVEQILTRTEEKLAGNRMIIYRCQSEINGALKRFELKYELNGCRWFLFKI